MMRSATDFLPLSISTLMNFATSTFMCFGSGRISRFGTSLRLGISAPSSQTLRLRFLRAVLRARLLAILDARRVERAANHVIANAGQVLDATAANEHDRVLLQVVTFAADVADDFEAVGQSHLGDLAQSGVRLLRRRRVDPRAHAALLRALLQRRHLAFRDGGLTALPHELIDGWHRKCPLWFSRVAHPSSRTAALVSLENQSGPSTLASRIA